MVNYNSNYFNTDSYINSIYSYTIKKDRTFCKYAIVHTDCHLSRVYGALLAKQEMERTQKWRDVVILHHRLSVIIMIITNFDRISQFHEAPAVSVYGCLMFAL